MSEETETLSQRIKVGYDNAAAYGFEYLGLSKTLPEGERFDLVRHHGETFWISDKREGRFKEEFIRIE